MSYGHFLIRFDAFPARWRAVKEDILESGSYDLTFEELQYGCNLAWRNEPRCPARIQWKNLVRIKILYCMTSNITYLSYSLSSQLSTMG
jgi:nitric oxide synthase oxygenase domain/subunit